MSYIHLTIEERCCLREYYKKGLSYREIAKMLGRSVSTVSRGLRRNCTHMYDIPSYYPHTAQKKYMLRRSYCHRGMYWNEETIQYINEKLKATWSPEQIACAPAPIKVPSWRTIYRWIYEKYLVNGNLKVLRRKGKTHAGKETRGKYNLGKSIRKRDKSVYSRKEAGHWEADTVVSGQGKSKACFATLAERKTRFYIAVKIPDRKASTMENFFLCAALALLFGTRNDGKMYVSQRRGVQLFSLFGEVSFVFFFVISSYILVSVSIVISFIILNFFF